MPTIRPSTQIEITPEMIEAGDEVMWKEAMDFYDETPSDEMRRLLTNVFEAMLNAASKGNGS